MWGIKDHHTLEAKVPVVIPRSVWLERVLPQTGYGKIHIIELPVVPIEKCANLKASCDALRQAQELHKQGFYDEAVGKCRLALEPLFEENEAKKKTLKRSWETRLGKVTYDWLNASFIVLKEPTNKAHHSPATYFDQLDAEMLLAVTTALVAYAAQAEAEPVIS